MCEARANILAPWNLHDPLRLSSYLVMSIDAGAPGSDTGAPQGASASAAASTIGDVGIPEWTSEWSMPYGLERLVDLPEVVPPHVPRPVPRRNGPSLDHELSVDEYLAVLQHHA